MARPNILPADMKLYSPMEPEGRPFLAGEPWPGDAWSDKPGGEPVGANAAAGALKDLIEASEQNEQLSQLLASKDHDLSLTAAERDAAVNSLAGAEQAARDAQAAQAEAEETAKGLTAERDAARAEAEKARGDAKAAEQLVETASQEKAAVVEQLNAANQTIADLNGTSTAKTPK